MKKLILFVIAIIIFNDVDHVYAQHATTTTGGDISGSGGSVAYSVGQIVYTTLVSTAGSVSHGVQQPYNISVVSGMDDLDIPLNIYVYPNPTTEFLTLRVAHNNRLIIYQLFDVCGKLLESNTIVTDVTTIKMEQYVNAIYFLTVIQDHNELKTFKIIKTK